MFPLPLIALKLRFLLFQILSKLPETFKRALLTNTGIGRLETNELMGNAIVVTSVCKLVFLRLLLTSTFPSLTNKERLESTLRDEIKVLLIFPVMRIFPCCNTKLLGH